MNPAPLITKWRNFLTRKRYPFLGLALAAMLGIFAAYMLPFSSKCYLTLSCLGVLAALLSHRTVVCLLTTSCIFASIFLWETKESFPEQLAAQWGEQRRVVEMEGVVANQPILYGSYARFTFRTQKLRLDDLEIRQPLDVSVFVSDNTLQQGDKLNIVGSVRRIPHIRNPGEFDARSWQWLHGVYFEASAESQDIQLLRRGDRWGMQKAATQIRTWMIKTLGEGIQNAGDTASVLQTIVFGNIAGTSAAVEESFRQTGTYHLFSVSGLHVAMLAAIFWYFFRLIRVHRGMAVVIIIPLLFAYAYLTGWRPSSIRAAFMGSVVLMGMVTSRPSQAMNSLGAAAFCILLFNPRELFDAGFQLSFGVVASIIVVADPMKNYLAERMKADPFLPRQLIPPHERISRAALLSVTGVACISAAAWLGSAPLCAKYFHIVSLSSIPANLFAVPIAFVIMALAVISLLAGLVSPWLAAIFNNANTLFVKILVAGIALFSRVPGSYVTVGPIPINEPLGEILVFDLGAGGAAVIHDRSETLLVDCGSERDARHSIIPYLQMRGVSSLDWLILSHGDARHIGGTEQILEAFDVHAIANTTVEDHSPHRLAMDRYLDTHRLPQKFLNGGEDWRPASDISTKILFPPKGFQERKADDKALVLLLAIGKTRILMTSDSGYATERLLMKSGQDLHADILVMGRHFSGLTGGNDFLSAVRPAAVITTVADRPPTESLSEDFEDRTQKLGAKLFRMDRTGAVRIRIYPDRYEMDSFLSDEHLIHRFYGAR